MKLYKNNYKGKWFVLADEMDPLYGCIGEIDSEEVDLEEHASNCLYYGIPMYIGNDDDFKQKCDEVFERIK